MAENNKQIQIATILGSVRPGNYTAKALLIIEQILRSNPNVKVTTIDPAKYNLSFPGIKTKNDHAVKLKNIIAEADGVIIATPEYHGTFSSMVKLVIENLGFPSALKGKPVSLLGVASGQIGAIKSLEALRSVCSHVGALVLPGPVSISGVQKQFDEDGKCTDPALEKKLQTMGNDLLKYVARHFCPEADLETYVREKVASN